MSAEPTLGNINDTLDRLLGKDARNELARERDEIMDGVGDLLNQVRGRGDLKDYLLPSLRPIFDELADKISVFSHAHAEAVIVALMKAHEAGCRETVDNAPRPSARMLAADLVDAIIREVKK